MPAAVTCSIKCRPTTAFSTPELPRLSSFHGARPADELQATDAGPALSLRTPDQGEPPALPKPPSARRAQRRRGREKPARLPMAAAAVLAGAQSRHAIFREELVRRAYYTADEAHRGHSSQPAATGSGLL
ncbi:hypothetical protein ZWY2020_026192 [Hordeum vulgare]|nr:hypothetical protein ZWY2020_026192 [Hordeum vulgare]